MAMIEKITLENMLPNVFIGMEETKPIKSSQIWKVPSFSFTRRCRMCVQAESGGGKSSLLSFIYGNRNDYQGKILFDDKDIRSFSVDKWCEIRTLSIALLPQEMRLFPELSAIQNIQLKNQRTNHKTIEEIEYLMERLGVVDRKDYPIGKMSIGQQQRVAIVRTVCQPFDFIFLDEPVSHLDEKNNRIVAEIIEEEASKQNAGIITTSVGNHLLLDNPQFVNL